MRKSAGAINGTNTALKYGGPTDNLPCPSASITSGYKVPSKTAAAATNSSTLLASSMASRDTGSKSAAAPDRSSAGVRQASSASELPTTSAKKNKIKTPRAGSVAKAWTELSTPERTMKVPSKESEKARMASSAVHILKPPRFSVTDSE